MPDFSKRSYQLELLDEENIPTDALYQNLKELAFINTYLGGHDVIKAGAKHFRKAQSILEIGSGGGDNLQAIAKSFPAQAEFYGVDLKETCTDYAISKNQNPQISFHTSDYRTFQPSEMTDVIFNSLFCHHFKDEDLVEMLKWMYKNSRMGFFIGDLHRHPLAYYSIKLLTSLFSKSYLVKNDAPLSVNRGFTQKDWELLLHKAGITNYQIQWKWAFRHLIVVKK